MQSRNLVYSDKPIRGQNIILDVNKFFQNMIKADERLWMELEHSNPKVRMEAFELIKGNIILLKNVLEWGPTHNDVITAIAQSLPLDILCDIVPRLWSLGSFAPHPAYKAIVEFLAPRVDEVDDIGALPHIALVSENSLARRVAVRKIAEFGSKSLLHEVSLSSAFEDTRELAAGLVKK